MIAERHDLMEKVTALCKRRGFVYPSSEIYGGINALYDYGPYGVQLRRNIRNLWWRHVVDLRDAKLARIAKLPPWFWLPAVVGVFVDYRITFAVLAAAYLLSGPAVWLRRRAATASGR